MTNQLLAYLVAYYSGDIRLKCKIRRCNKYLNIELAKTITHIDGKYHMHITDMQVKNMYNIEELYLSFFSKITDKGLSKVHGLKTLDIMYNENITDNALKNLVNLEKLEVNLKVTDMGIQAMKLKELTINFNNNITDNCLKKLCNLEWLTLLDNAKITNRGIEYLTKLRYLNLIQVTNITGDGIKNLSNLEKIIFDNPDLLNSLHSLSKLKRISYYGPIPILLSKGYLQKLPNLKIISSKLVSEEMNKELKKRNVTIENVV